MIVRCGEPYLERPHGSIAARIEPAPLDSIGFVALSDIRQELTPFYSSTGRPSIDPELIIQRNRPNSDNRGELVQHRKVLWRQAGLTPSFRQGCRQRGGDANGIAVFTRTEGWLQRQHLPGGGFGFRRSPEFGKRCRQ